MLLLLFGVYVLASGKLQVTRGYGVRGKGARIGGGVCIGVALSAQVLLSVFGVPLGVATSLSLIGLFVVVPVTMVLLVRIYGNDFAKDSLKSRV